MYDTTTATRLTDEHIAAAPRSVDDLPEYMRRGDSLAYISLNDMPNFDITAKAVAFLAVCEKSGELLVEKGTYRVDVYRKLTQEQVIERLADASETWDQSADRYDAAMVSGTRPEDYSDRSAIESYCRKRKLTVPWEQ